MQKKPWQVKGFIFLMLILLLALSSCQKAETQAQFQPLFALLEEKGWEHTLLPLSESAGESISVPIYDASVWYSLRAGLEEWLVYFDSSNRAPYLAEKFCADGDFGKVSYVGLRFILCYGGKNTEVLEAMEEWQKAYPT